MTKPPPRDILKMIFTNFIKSLMPKKTEGVFKGSDYFGNKYYEVAKDPSIGKRNDRRWFVPQDGETFEDVPAEWDSWLRGRRKEPPKEEEIMKNLAISKMKKINALEVAKKSSKPSKRLTGFESFPIRPEYEVFPGESQKKSKS